MNSLKPQSAARQYSRNIGAKSGSNGSSSNRNTSRAGTESRVSPAVHWRFTLNNYTEDEITYILETCSNGSKFYMFQEEIGEECGTPHLQGHISFLKKVRPMSVFKDTKRISWRKSDNPQGSINYASKEKTRAPDGRQWSSHPIQRPLDLLDPKDFHPWQNDIIDIINKVPCNRTIYWFWEPIGGVGKSVFTKYLCAQRHALLLSGKGADCKFGIIQYMKKNMGRHPQLIIYDIPRSNLGYVSYTALEEIKNGCFFSSKYESDMIIMNSPHLICFANEEPDYHTMSADRWKVNKIE